MNTITDIFRRGITAVLVLLLVGMAPTPVFAQTTDAADSGAAPAGEQSTQPAEGGPTGPEAGTYHFDSGTGLWENDYYTYNPSTKETVPKEMPEYTYNPATAQWDTYIWQFNTATGAYEQALVSLPVPPAGAVTHGGPVAEAQVPATVTSEETSVAASEYEERARSEEHHEEHDTTRDITTNVEMETNINSDATSGDALAAHNDDVGSVETGDATAVANIVNFLQTQASLSGAGLSTFTANIQGGAQGDFIIDPLAIAQPAAAGSTSLSNATINTHTNGAIVNNITLNAVSGNATAEDNDDVGSVATGDATAIANVINMINSVVAANQSFVGVINIYGDYSGNILMPIDSLNALLATADSGLAASSDTNVTTDSNMTITNNVDLSAASGNATARNNDDVGTVATGDGMTNLTILNLTGRQIVAANSLLVFVNVLGSWVGLIMDAPAGTTSAALGGGVQSGDLALAGNADIHSDENFSITNNITANARTGDALATNNDDVGSVTSGNALAKVNLTNIINSSFSLSNWFGILFINVFGAWNGNFGVMKPPVVPPITSGAAIPGRGGGAEELFKDAKVFTFVPAGSSSGGAGGSSENEELRLSPVAYTTNDTGGGNGDEGTTIQKAGALMGAVQGSSQQPGTTVLPSAENGISSFSVALIVLGSLGLALVAGDRLRYSLRRQPRSVNIHARMK